jgi:Putative Ig domain
MEGFIGWSLSSLARLSVVLIATGALFLSACGGGGGNSGGSGSNGNVDSTPTAPSGLSYSGSSFTFTVGQAITALSPTVTGTVTAYQATLPAGLQINTTTGVISGTPQQLSAAATYQVTTSNSAGQTTATLSITVTNTTVGVTYPAPSITFTVGVAGSVPPTCSSCGANWSVSPALPAGLTIDPVAGTIGGTPTAASAATTYTVTAQAGSAGAPTFSLTIAVAAAPLVQLGHNRGISSLKTNGQQVLSQDDLSADSGNTQHWVLWDYTSAHLIAQGDANCSGCIETFPTYLSSPSDIAGSTFVIVTGAGLEVRSTTDGHILSTLSTPAISWWKLASDGSYIVGGSTAGLYVWNPAGQVLVSHTGDYSKANVFAGSTALQVALGAAGAQVIETIAISTGTASVSGAFQGNFGAWFTDGGSFITNTGTVTWVYSGAAVQLEMLVLPSYTSGVTILGGSGTLFWVAQTGGASTLNVYTVGGSTTTPTATYSLAAYLPQVSGPTIAVAGSGSLNILDLSGASPVVTNYTTPSSWSVYAQVSSSQVVTGSGSGVIADVSTSTPRYFDYGQALSIAASSGAGRAAIATGSGSILYFDTTTNTLVSTINFPATKIALSADGTTLAAITSTSSSSSFNVAVYQPPSTTPIYTQQVASPGPTYVSLSANGQVMVLDDSVLSLPSGSVILSGAPGTIYLSPDGTLAAASTGQPVAGTTTNIYTNGTLTTAVNGYTLGWIDNNDLLVNNFSVNSIVINYLGCSIYSATGTANGFCNLPQLPDFQQLSSTLVYWPERNKLLTVATGGAAWLSGSPLTGVSAANGSDVVFVSDAQVLSEPYTH